MTDQEHKTSTEHKTPPPTPLKPAKRVSVSSSSATEKASSTAPTIETIDPEVAKVGDTITITGTNFGTDIGSVTVGGFAASVVMDEDTEQSPVQSTPAWTDTEVKVAVPEVNILKYAGQGMARHDVTLTTADPDNPQSTAPFQLITVA
jgi:hypothetical protein